MILIIIVIGFAIVIVIVVCIVVSYLMVVCIVISPTTCLFIICVTLVYPNDACVSIGGIHRNFYDDTTTIIVNLYALVLVVLIVISITRVISIEHNW